jgi:hypothetical protein
MSHRRKANNAVMGPLVGARAHRWVNAPPSSGSSALPFNAHEPVIGVLKHASTTVPSRTAATSHSRLWHRLLPSRLPVKQRQPWWFSSAQLRVAAVTPRCYCSSYSTSIVASTVFIQFWLQYKPNSMKMVFSTNGDGSF